MGGVLKAREAREVESMEVASQQVFVAAGNTRWGLAFFVADCLLCLSLPLLLFLEQKAFMMMRRVMSMNNSTNSTMVRMEKPMYRPRMPPMSDTKSCH